MDLQNQKHNFKELKQQKNVESVKPGSHYNQKQIFNKQIESFRPILSSL